MATNETDSGSSALNYTIPTMLAGAATWGAGKAGFKKVMGAFKGKGSKTPGSTPGSTPAAAPAPTANQTLANPEPVTPTAPVPSAPTVAAPPVTSTPAGKVPRSVKPQPMSEEANNLAQKLAKSRVGGERIPKGVNPKTAEQAVKGAEEIATKEAKPILKGLEKVSKFNKLQEVLSKVGSKGFKSGKMAPGAKVDLSKIAKFGSAVLAGAEGVAATPLVSIGLPVAAALYGANEVRKSANGLKSDTAAQTNSEQDLNKITRLADYADEAMGKNGELIRRVMRATRPKKINDEMDARQ